MLKCFRIIDEMERRAGLQVTTKRTRSGFLSVSVEVSLGESASSRAMLCTRLISCFRKRRL